MPVRRASDGGQQLQTCCQETQQSCKRAFHTEYYPLPHQDRNMESTKVGALAFCPPCNMQPQGPKATSRVPRTARGPGVPGSPANLGGHVQARAVGALLEPAGEGGVLVIPKVALQLLRARGPKKRGEREPCLLGSLSFMNRVHQTKRKKRCLVEQLGGKPEEETSLRPP